MKNKNNPSLQVEFITTESFSEKQQNNFGTLSAIKGLAFNPETTGANIFAESMVQRQVADKRDLEIYNRAIPQISFESKSPELERIMEQENDQVMSDSLPPIIIPPLGTGIAEDAHPEFERVIDTPDFLPAWFFKVGAERARAVCKIETSGTDFKGEDGYWSGTGFLISPNLLLTNNHVLNSKDVARKAICMFNYETDETGKAQSIDTYSLDPEKIFITSNADGGLDFTVCWIEDAAAAKYGFIPVYRHAFGIKNSDCANIVQHPDGRHKSVVIQKNEVRSQSDIAVLYSSDTEPGSSGAFVCNNAWKLVALHHASREMDMPGNKSGKPVYLNEGIKMAAIAAYLEGLSDSDKNYSMARQVLDTFNGIDSAMGYFGSLGRQNDITGANSDLERVVTSYRGEDKDMDICFWNIEWFNKTYPQKLKDVAWEISIQNLDVWVLSESSPNAADALVKYLKVHYDLDYDYLASEPNAPESKQTTTVIWNTRTTSITKQDWPEKVEKWLKLSSSHFKDLTELQQGLELEAVDGKIFDRYPGLFKVESLTTLEANTEPLNFYLVPLHLKAMAEGSKRRQFACRILAQAMEYCIKNHNFNSEWILGGDLNATIASKDLEELTSGGLIAMSASDASQNAFSYLKKPYQSLIDHIYLSPNLTERTDKDGFMILARERDTTRDGNGNSNYLGISDHRPIMVRLSICGKAQKIEEEIMPEDKAIAKELLEMIHI